MQEPDNRDAKGEKGDVRRDPCQRSHMSPLTIRPATESLANGASDEQQSDRQYKNKEDVPDGAGH